MFLSLLIITAIIIIKYKPMYQVKLGDREIGYVEDKENIKNYIQEQVKEEKNIAFIDLKENVSMQLQLVNRSTENEQNNLEEQIKENINIEYTTYAVTYNGNNIAYVSNDQEAQEVIDSVKKEYNDKDTEKLGYLQVYSNNYDDIKVEEIKDATKKVSKEIKNNNNKNVVKVAKVKTSNKINGVSFTVKPLSGIITSRYGLRNSPGGIGSTNHKGLDISSKTGAAIKAASSGTVKFAGYKGSLGNLVIIDNGKNVETYYAHCSKLYVKSGQKVKAGTVIAAVGQTGAATGPHLHFEIHVNGVAVNPQRYLYR